MAQKTIISDFSALKEKVTFSEKNADAKVSPKVTPTVATMKPKESDKGLKTGQSVVLMDSNLRGKIIGIKYWCFPCYFSIGLMRISMQLL